MSDEANKDLCRQSTGEIFSQKNAERARKRNETGRKDRRQGIERKFRTAGIRANENEQRLLQILDERGDEIRDLKEQILSLQDSHVE